MAIVIEIIVISMILRTVSSNPKGYLHDRGSRLRNAEDIGKFRGWDPEAELARIRRFDNDSQDLSQNLDEVKGALKEILSGRNVEELFTYQSEDTTHTHATSLSHMRVHTTDSESNEVTNLEDQTLRTHIRVETTDDASILEEQELTTVVATRSKDPTTIETVETLKIEEVNTDIANPKQDTTRVEETRFPEETRLLLLRAGDKGTTPINDTNATIPLCYTTTSTTTTTTPTTTTTTPKFDIPALMDIISNFTYEWLENLTRQVNDTLMKKGIPTCPELTTPPPPSTYGQNMTGTLMGKCFHCGLEDTGIPNRAYCADAFAGDFLPLVPVDPRARSEIAKYRKYCRYIKKDKYYQEKGDSRILWGSFTGGCAVRWIDLSGVYTQRVCRIRHRPLMGKHYGSKRMAKLELALQNVDNGCVISPMSSLVPLSRGVSLYARFHACVCTGNWCNRAVVNQPWTMYIAFVSVYFIVEALSMVV